MAAVTLVVMFSKDSCNSDCKLCLMLSGTMFEMGFTVWLGDKHFVEFLLGEAMNLS